MMVMMGEGGMIRWEYGSDGVCVCWMVIMMYDDSVFGWEYWRVIMMENEYVGGWFGCMMILWEGDHPGG